MPSFQELLEDFVGPDVALAQAAFDRLAQDIRPSLLRYFRRRLHSSEAREDAVGEVIQKLWQSRRAFKPGSELGWRRYIMTIASRGQIDAARRSGSRPTEMLLDSIDSFAEEDNFAAQFLDAALRGELYDVADRHWLGWKEALPRSERDRRVLAAKLLIIDKMPWRSVCRLVHLWNDMGEPDRLTLESWLAEEGPYLTMAFDELYIPSSKLADLVVETLGIDPECEQADWIRKRAAAAPIQERNDELNDRWLVTLPFNSVVKALQLTLASPPSKQNLLAQPGLWKRLVFQYYAVDELPHKDIAERTASAAREAGFELNATTLNNWLSMGRLAGELAKVRKTWSQA
jgi:DNA-directed RNA polymerase specialized sigma24 family protein